jgi:outer membrane protein TolC
MHRRPGRPTFVSLIAILVAAVSVVPALAQMPPAPAPPPVDSTLEIDEREGDDVYRPPLMTFPDNRISLLEAVRLTIAHDPNLKLQQESVQFQRGVWQTEMGRFDTALRVDGTLQYTQEELRQSQQRAEQQRREDIQELIDEFQQVADRAEARFRELERLKLDPTGVRITDPSIQGQVDVLNNLIASTADPETRAEFVRVRDELIEQYRAAYEKLAVDTRADEMEQREKLRKLGAIPRVNVNYLGIVNFTVDKPFRNGIIFSPYFETSFEGTRFQGKRKEAEFGGKGIEDLYRFIVGFDVNIPLGRGGGEESFAAFERAANIDWEASINSFRHGASASVLNTVLAYWNLVAAQRRVDVARQSAELQTQRVATSRALIEGDELARAELARVLASEATDLALVLSAERNLHTARIALARAVGLAVESEDNAPFAADDFPPPMSPEAVEALDGTSLVAAALRSRYDYRSALQLQQSGRVLLRAAQLDLRPIVDLTTGLSYTAVGETTIADAVDKWVGPSGHLGLFYSRPIGNNTFKGIVLQRQAMLNQRGIQAVDLARNIRNNTLLTIRSLEETLEQLLRSAEAVEFYRETIAAEEEKFRMGSSTLIDTILTQQLQTSALLGLVTAQQQYANLLAQLRYETGMLVEQRDEGSAVNLENLLTLPPAQPAVPAE